MSDTITVLTTAQQAVLEQAIALVKQADKLLTDAQIAHFFAIAHSFRKSADGTRAGEQGCSGCYAPHNETDPGYSYIVRKIEDAYQVNGGYMAMLRDRAAAENG